MNIKPIDGVIPTEDLMKLSLMIKALEKGYLRDRLIKLLDYEGNKAAKKVLETALKDGHVTDEQVEYMKQTYGAKQREIAELFKVHYEMGMQIDDGKPENSQAVMVTMKGSTIWKMKDYVKENFGIKIIEHEEMMQKIMQSDLLPDEDEISYIG